MTPCSTLIVGMRANPKLGEYRFPREQRQFSVLDGTELLLDFLLPDGFDLHVEFQAEISCSAILARSPVGLRGRKARPWD